MASTPAGDCLVSGSRHPMIAPSCYTTQQAFNRHALCIVQQVLNAHLWSIMRKGVMCTVRSSSITSFVAVASLRSSTMVPCSLLFTFF